MYVPLLKMDEKQPLLKSNENQSQVVDVENAGKKKIPITVHTFFLCKWMTLNLILMRASLTVRSLLLLTHLKSVKDSN